MLIFILFILIGGVVVDLFVELLNLRRVRDEVPEEFQGLYDPEKYKRSQRYLEETTRFVLVKNGIAAVVYVFFILSGGFNFFDTIARSFDRGPIVTGLIFAGMLLLTLEILMLPFAVYRTFVLEEKFGFNRTTPATFIADKVKSLCLGGLIGAGIFSCLLFFFQAAIPWAWALAWGVVVFFEIFLTFLAPVVILPLFNRFVPLEDGPLKSAIEEFARSQNFKLSGIFKMDASKRSSKTNAFFIGFGRFRRIVLFDTLIQKHTTEELVSVLAHEIGHYQEKHILKNLGLSVLNTGVMLFLLSFFIENEGLFQAFRMERLSVYASLIFFGFLYGPLQTVFSVAGNILSRKFEYEADAYAARTYQKPRELESALKKLSVDNLSNLTPHPLKVFLDYSHPPVLDRLRALRSRTVLS